MTFAGPDRVGAGTREPGIAAQDREAVIENPVHEQRTLTEAVDMNDRIEYRAIKRDRMLLSGTAVIGDDIAGCQRGGKERPAECGRGSINLGRRAPAVTNIAAIADGHSA